MADLPHLLAQTGTVGVDVELVLTGAPRPLPAGLERSAYRVVQEALTNVVKHVGTDRARVGVEYGADAVVIEVTDHGRAAPAIQTGTASPECGNGSRCSVGSCGPVRWPATNTGSPPAFRTALAGGGSDRAVVVADDQTLVRVGLCGIDVRLHIAASTAKTHVARLLHKLSARDRVQLVILAYRTGVAS